MAFSSRGGSVQHQNRAWGKRIGTADSSEEGTETEVAGGCYRIQKQHREGT